MTLPLILLILDGWGYRKETQYNAIAAANTPHWDHLWNTYPHSLLIGSGKEVGLPNGQMGNSEVGHMTIGMGRCIEQDLVRIDRALHTTNTSTLPLLTTVCQQLKKKNAALHLMGLLSDGGVHSHIHHIETIANFALQQNIRVYLHAFLDGRDTPPNSAQRYIQRFEKNCPHCPIVSIIGRFYALDRDKRWERIKSAYDLIINGIAARTASTPLEALQLANEMEESDEFVQATSIFDKKINGPITLQPGDAYLFMNFRADRARELTQALSLDNFPYFERNHRTQDFSGLTLTQYEKNQIPAVLFPVTHLNQGLGEILSANKYTQLRIAETEKYPHVTFFFNGGRETVFKNETRVLIPSAKVKTYDLVPAMQIPKITKILLQHIQDKQHDVIICNFANADMLGHTGNFEACKQGIEAIDQALGELYTAIKQHAGELIITADHGNAENMYNEEDKQAHTAHTTAPVPFVYIGRSAVCTQQTGSLADIAPTLLALLGEPIPKSMTGKNLLCLI